ncbi:ribokinase [Corynebacterium alimapuense]|uniref:Ribokinase n=1 Tax=Corynebacterium alimapuense TaxID=1576874 RepID=A0A3M8KAQ9_9CORY|nr:ribokinase [Corynebacterium alimapuense]RNE49612.1 ribokinase [Corynebacterium alimapuense]
MTTQDSTCQIVVVGSINADLTVRVGRHPLPGETLLGTGGEVTAGGKGANQAVAAALQGASVALVGAVGNDPYAAPATEFLCSSGVEMSAVSTVKETTGLAVISVSEDGENSIVVVPGANATVDATAVAAHKKLIADADIVLLQGEIPADGFAQAVKLATGRVVVNLAPVIPVDRAALLHADPIMANEHEAGLILQQLGIMAASEDPQDLAQGLLDAGFRSVVLTLGGAGALVAQGTQLITIPTPKVSVVDTTGAGDAFAGAFVAELLSGTDKQGGANLVAAAQQAARVGAFAVTSRGAQVSYPGLHDQLPAID